ncbi:hypothetical protein EDB87DRAFT_1636812 [Lactarius vividus]|nr:hypothetical protein EDB87DRAFT_1636812 [Lactarius vividus]
MRQKNRLHAQDYAKVTSSKLQSFNHHAYQFHDMNRTYGKVAHVYGCFRGQDIQLAVSDLVSDPKACNNIVIKNQLVFEQTESVL